MKNRRWLAIAAVAGCTGAPQPRAAMPVAPVPVPAARAPMPAARERVPRHAGGASVPGKPDDTRGTRVELPRLGFEHALQIRRSRNGIVHELHDGDQVMTGDRFRASLLTSQDAYLYLAFCSHHELAVYPSARGIRARAGQLVVVPEGDAELVFDSDPGPEVLYVILSRTEIAIADPQLARALAATRSGNAPEDCSARLDTGLAKPVRNGPAASSPTSATRVLRGAVVRKQPISSAHAPADPGSSASALAPPQPDAATAAGAPRDPDFERSPGDIVWYRVDGGTDLADVVAADDDGIAVVRYAFTHVPRGSAR